MLEHLSDEMMGAIQIGGTILGLVLIYLAYVGGTYLLLFRKRAKLLSQLKSICDRRAYRLTLCKGRYDGILGRQGGEHLTIETVKRIYHVAIFTTRYRKYRYHFLTDGRCEVVRNWSMNTITNGKSYRAHTVSIEESSLVIRRTNAPFFDTKNQLTRSSEKKEINILLTHPIPHQVTAIIGNQLVSIGNGDRLPEGAVFYSGEGFRQMLEDENE